MVANRPVIGPSCARTASLSERIGGTVPPSKASATNDGVLAAAACRLTLFDNIVLCRSRVAVGRVNSDAGVVIAIAAIANHNRYTKSGNRGLCGVTLQRHRLAVIC